MADIKLTQYSHGGGCGCKIAPGLLSEILGKIGTGNAFPNLLVGSETSDDAAVWRLNDSQAIVATTDFFMPIVDDPHDFGRIAATNAISDIYAMGAQPLFALAIVGMPVDKLPVEAIQGILAGGAAVCAAAGIPIAGGHSIDSPEPIYGLVVLGLVHPDQVKRNNRAQAGDRLILGKGLGIGVMSAALKKAKLDAAGYQVMLSSTTQLNTPGVQLAAMEGVHALTDVTGFGLLGHLLEVCRGSNLSARLAWEQIPLLPGVGLLAQQGFTPGAAERNWASYAAHVELKPGMADWQRKLLCDPQTSGGLLVACRADLAPQILLLFQDMHFEYASDIGEMITGAPRVLVG